MTNESPALLQQARAEEHEGRGREQGGEIFQHARTSGDVGEPSGLAAGLVNIGVALAHQELGEDGVAVIVALDGDQGIVVLAGEEGDARGQGLGGKCP